jgi:glycerophosphoryl diester phosphodiesterase
MKTSPAQQQGLNSEWVERVHQAGLGIISWPVNNEAERDAMQKLGVDIVWHTQAVYTDHNSTDRSSM